MPSDAKSSPVFQLVSPATVPAHSFFQICTPICFASAGEMRIFALLPTAEPAAGGGGASASAGLQQGKKTAGIKDAAKRGKENEIRFCIDV